MRVTCTGHDFLCYHWASTPRGRFGAQHPIFSTMVPKWSPGLHQQYHLIISWQYRIIISCRQNWLPTKTGQALGTFSILHKCETGRGDTFSLLEDAAHGAITMDMPDCFCYKVCHWKHRQLREAFVFWQQDGVCHYDFLKDASRKPFNCRRAAKQPCQYKDLSKH